jgi:hypothetical protein
LLSEGFLLFISHSPRFILNFVLPPFFEIKSKIEPHEC